MTEKKLTFGRFSEEAAAAPCPYDTGASYIKLAEGDNILRILPQLDPTSEEPWVCVPEHSINSEEGFCKFPCVTMINNKFASEGLPSCGYDHCMGCLYKAMLIKSGNSVDRKSAADASVILRWYSNAIEYVNKRPSEPKIFCFSKTVWTQLSMLRKKGDFTDLYTGRCLNIRRVGQKMRTKYYVQDELPTPAEKPSWVLNMHDIQDFTTPKSYEELSDFFGMTVQQMLDQVSNPRPRAQLVQRQMKGQESDLDVEVDEIPWK